MFLLCFFENRLVVEEGFNFREESRFLIFVVRFDEFGPGEAVAQEVSLISVGDDESLAVYGVVTAKDRIV